MFQMYSQLASLSGFWRLKIQPLVKKNGKHSCVHKLTVPRLGSILVPGYKETLCR